MTAMLNEWGSAWTAYFVPLLAQNTVFLALVFLALHLLRHASVRVRAAVATIGVIKLVIPPFLPLALGGATAVETAAVPSLLIPFAETAVAEPIPATGGLTLAASIMIAWTSVVLARLGWVGLQTLQLVLAVRGALPVPAAQVPAAISGRGITVWSSPRVPLPMTLGPWPRRIYLPEAWTGWSGRDRLAVLHHEAAHIARRDGLVRVAEILGMALWFFHPLAVLLVGRLRVWREMVCDDAAVAPDTGARLAYSRFLADLAESALVPTLATESASTLYRGESELLSRVSHQIREGTRMRVSRNRIIVVVGLLVAAALPLSLVLAEPAPPAPPVEPAAVAPTAEPVPAPDVEPAAPAAPAVDDKDAKRKQKQKPEKAEAPAVKQKPAKATAKGQAPTKAHHLVLTGERIAMDGHEMPLPKLAIYLDKVAAKSRQAKKTPIVVIETAGDTSMGRIHAVQALLVKNELTKVVYKGEQGRKMAMALPTAKFEEKLASLPPEEILTVHVDGEGTALVNGRPTKCAKVGAAVAKALQAQPDLVVALRTDETTAYEDFVMVLAGVKEAGCKRIAIQSPGA